MTLLDAEGMYWWAFYEVPLDHLLALWYFRLNWSEKLKDISKTENPAKAFLEFARRRQLN